MRRAVLVAGVLFLASSVLAQDHTTGVFQGCPPEGKRKSSRGFYDPALNALKNRDVPPDSYMPRLLADVIANQGATSMGIMTIRKREL